MSVGQKYRKVEGSIEAAIGAGILAGVLTSHYSHFIEGVEADESQTGDEAEFFVHTPSGVILRCVVTEVA